MKAAVVNDYSQSVEIKDVPVPELEYGDVLIKMQTCGVCHTDMHSTKGDWPIKPDLPVIPGHEGVGIVERVADGVKTIKVGDRVGLPWLYSACGECEYCLQGRETVCADKLLSGYLTDGAYAEYAKAPGEYVVKIPDELDSVDASPILCAGVTTYKGLKVSGAIPGDWVAIYGIGGLGHLAVQYAKAMGFNVVAVDIHEDKLSLAKKLGANKTVNSANMDPAQFIQEEVGGVQAAISVAVAQKPFEQAYHSIKNGGTLVSIALLNDELPINIFDIATSEIAVKGSHVGGRKDQQEALNLAVQGNIKANISTDSLDNVNEVWEKMEQGKIDGRIVLKINE